VKVEKLESIIEMSRKSKGEPFDLMLEKQQRTTPSKLNEEDSLHSEPNTSSDSLTQSLLSRLLLNPSPNYQVSILECLKRLATICCSWNELFAMDLDTVKYQHVQYLPKHYNGDVIFELPPCHSSSSSSVAKNLEGMDRRMTDNHGVSL